ncbi:MAG TPA: DUF456 domain-containing protein, partial [Phycisphaerae bacterium]|nr:DUF456 domain-containing protein [Phycisphaerae bacterium]
NTPMHYLLYALLMLLSLAAIALNIFSIPGNWIMALAALLVSWLSGWTAPHPVIFLLILIVLLAAEAIELAGSMLGAKKFGASKSATWAAVFGAIAGAIIGVPVPIIGPVLGALLGAFFAAWLTELMHNRPLKDASWAALGAALGRGFGLVAKIGCGLIIWITLAFAAFPR